MSNENNQIDEVEVTEAAATDATAAANQATIAAKPTNVSKTDLISQLVAYATKASREDLASFVSSIGGEPGMNPNAITPDDSFNSTQSAANAAGDNSAKNMASIKSSGKHADPMPSIKEDLSLLFGDDESLSEDFRLKVSTLFEAAVSTRVNMEVAKLEEENESFKAQLAEQYDITLNEAVEEITNEMVENVDNYLNYAVAEWMTENKLAVTNNIKTQVAESFMASLKNVFEEHYVEIPDDQADVVEALAAEVEDLKARLNETTEKNIELTKVVNEKEIDSVVSSMSEGLTDTQKEKFTKLVEAVNYSDVKEFRKKASIIKETYFQKIQEVKVAKDQLLSETVEEPAKAPAIDPAMQTYVSSISKILKK